MISIVFIRLHICNSCKDGKLFKLDFCTIALQNFMKFFLTTLSRDLWRENVFFSLSSL